MKRRQLLGIAGLTASGGLAVGTNAFNFANVERDVSIAVVNDDTAFLRLEALHDPGIDGDATLRSADSGRKVYFQIPGSGPGESDAAEGVGTDSIYEFEDLVRITNHGSRPVELYSEYDGTAFTLLALLGDSGPLMESDPHSLAVGESVEAGIYIDSHGSDLGDYDETLSIVADATDDS